MLGTAQLETSHEGPQALRTQVLVFPKKELITLKLEGSVTQMVFQQQC